MISRRHLKRSLGLAGCWLALAACQAQSPQEAADLAPKSAGQGGASGNAGIASSDAPSSGAGGELSPNDDTYRVELRAADTTLCPGECTTLTAEVSNGAEPYAYAWSPAELEGAGPIEVCPSQTTTYEILATDSFSTIEEFGGEDRRASSALQVVVKESCDPPDGGAELPPDAEPGQPICELRIQSNSASSFNPAYAWGALRNMNVDAEGNLYFVATIGGPIQIGDMSVEGKSDSASGLVVKLSPSCAPIWLKPLLPASGSLWMTALAVSPSGDDIYVTGGLEGSVSFAGDTIDVGGNDSGLLLRLDGQGEVLWVEAVTGTHSSRVNDVAITDDGDVIVTGFTLDGGRFSDVSLGTEELTSTAFVARVRPTGESTFLHTIRNSVEDLSVLLLPSGSLALMGSGFNTAPQELAGGLIEGAGEGWNVFIAVLEATAGNFVWGKTVRRGPDHGWTSFASTSMTVDRSGHLLIDESHYETPPSGTVTSTPPELIRIDAAGNELWSRERLYPRTSSNHWSGGLAVDSENHILVADEVLDGTVAEDGAVLEASGYSDVMLSKRSDGGDLIWRWQSSGTGEDWCWGVATDAHDAIWVGTGSLTPETSAAELVITRLAP